MTRSERYCEDYRLMDLEARFAPAPLHGSPDAGLEEGCDDYEMDRLECESYFECDYGDLLRRGES